MLTRRSLLIKMALAAGYGLLPLSSMSFALASPQPTRRRFIFILMRGAVDGLSIVTPYREDNYYNLRSTIAIPRPGQEGGLIDLDGHFGLHPALQGLMPLWQNRTLAFIQASGSPSPTRSHFEAQDIIETALLNTSLAKQGWMNGLAQALPDNRSPTRALSFGNTLPKIFQGHYDVTTVPTGLKGNANKEAFNSHQEGEFGKLYAEHPELNKLYNQALTAHETMMQDLQGDMQNEMTASAKDAPQVDAFTKVAGKAAMMIKNDPSVELVFMDVGGWDTHVGQGNSKGQLANKLGRLGEGLTTLIEGLGSTYQDCAILIMSEFGRTVAENGNHGTDHGHGNVAWLMGGNVKGGKIWGRWPSLDRDKLYEGRDLAVTTDFRSVLGNVLASQFELPANKISEIIAGYQSDAALTGLL